jgi:hypothetical protein
MGVFSFIERKLLAIGCFIGCVFLVSVGLPLAFPNTGLELPPVTFTTLIGDISLIIAVLLFFACIYYWQSTANE